ncbi:MAG: hypothetical protein QOF33_2192 [Thermomicrobiales bacterium]|nr:hypothetical protein [Thermomicrobiales bacterium]MEA2584107.1 hypothetical protein [Thermomicrobiales bacterium]
MRLKSVHRYVPDLVPKGLRPRLRPKRHATTPWPNDGAGCARGDLSPMRPWEWELCDAGLWTEAQELRAAWEQGVSDAQQEAQAEAWLRQDGVGEAG